MESGQGNPDARLAAVEAKLVNLTQEVIRKQGVQEHMMDMSKKADIDTLKNLEASMLKLNGIINDFGNRFADRLQNDKDHKLLQKNLKNLYDLFMSLKGEGNEDDPMFTTKGLSCAACAKGVQNMVGFRADHVPWNNFPFKEPGPRMAKTG